MDDEREFDVFYTLEASDGRSVEIPYKENPIRAESLEDLVFKVGPPVPKHLNLGIRLIGVRVLERLGS